MASPIILYRNIFRTTGAVITTSGTDAGFSASDVGNHKAWQGWQGNVLTSPQYINIDCLTAVTADSILIVNHNMVANGGQVTIFANTVDPPTANTVQAAYSPTSDVADYKAFNSANFRYWRVQFTDPAAPFASKPFAGEILLGTKVDVAEFASADTDPFMHDIIGQTTRSEGPPQHALGTVLRGIDRSGVLNFGGECGVASAKFTSDLTDFLQNHYRKYLGWGLVFDSADSRFSAARWMIRPNGAKVPSLPVGGSYSRFRFDLAYEPALVEAA